MDRSICIRRRRIGERRAPGKSRRASGARFGVVRIDARAVDARAVDARAVDALAIEPSGNEAGRLIVGGIV